MSVAPEVEAGHESARATQIDWGRRKLWLVLLMFGFATLSGVIQCFVDESDSTTELLVSLPLLILGIAWCFLDAKQRNHRIGRVMKLLMVLLFGLALPIYLIQSRGRRGIVTFLQVLGVVIGLGLVAEASAWVTLFIGDQAGWWSMEW
jgi:hypothetical protein